MSEIETKSRLRRKYTQKRDEWRDLSLRESKSTEKDGLSVARDEVYFDVKLL